MLLETFSALFDELELNPNQRKHASRALVRVLCKLCTYRNEVDSHLREALGKDVERRLFRWWQNQRTNRDMLMLVWRGVHCLIATDNAEYAEHVSGIHQRDLRYAVAQLNQKDVQAIKRSELNWRKQPVTQKQIQKILASVNGTLKHYAYKLRFLEMSDSSLTSQDIMSMLKLEALALITRYESERSILHVKNTVLRGLKSYWSETVSYYKRAKRDLMPSHEVEDCNGKHFDYESIRQGLTVRAHGDDSDGEMENPALLSKCVTIDKDLETRSLIKYVRKRVPRYGKYLGLCVLEKRNKVFHRWLKANGKTTTTTTAFQRSARVFCGVTQRDEERARKILSNELGFSLV